MTDDEFQEFKQRIEGLPLAQMLDEVFRQAADIGSRAAHMAYGVDDAKAKAAAEYAVEHAALKILRRKRGIEREWIDARLRRLGYSEVADKVASGGKWYRWLWPL